MEVIITIAVVALIWLVWQLFKAKRFNKFKLQIEQDLKPQVIAHIIDDLEEKRTELCPNNQVHQEATIYFWTEYKSRIL